MSAVSRTLALACRSTALFRSCKIVKPLMPTTKGIPRIDAERKPSGKRLQDVLSPHCRELQVL